MKIKLIEIQNFRKLKCCRIELNDKETIFVGANNSGKTSAMEALIRFLKKDKAIMTTDFTIANWKEINKIGQEWIETSDENKYDLSLETWRLLLPSLDIWLNVDKSEAANVINLIPDLNWDGGDIGVRLILEPQIEKLYKDFKKEYNSAKKIKESSPKGDKSQIIIWPNNLKDFLDEKLYNYFSLKTYPLDYNELKTSENYDAQPQKLATNAEPFERNYLKGLLRIDVINAQRGFCDANSDGINLGNTSGGLTSQSKQLFEDYLNPQKEPSINDIDALEAIEAARQSFDLKLNSSFKSIIGEIENIGYPGFTDPNIEIRSKINLIDSINHDSSVCFSILKTETESENIDYLPERYNGLGYQNLISMILRLIRFRYDWMKEGKTVDRQEGESIVIEPLHLVLIEEPEAHLHAQVQQVFIRKAYSVLRNHPALRDSEKFTTQLLVSTHSAHIAHETDFKCLRYFKRKIYEQGYNLPCSTVVNLSQVFGTDIETGKFVTRYLKLTHCDLFFADAVILVEGPAEKLLIPAFIKRNYPILELKYITVLEIGGSHAHRLRPLIEILGLITLVITDIDSKEKYPDPDDPEKTKARKALPLKNINFISSNDTLTKWIPQKENLIELLELKEDEKISEDSCVRVAYQYPFNIQFNVSQEELIPYTFEDALVFTNMEIFKKWSNPKGLIKKMQNALNRTDIQEARKVIFEALEDGKKAEMALELLFADEDILIPPQYIAEGLKWMQNKLNNENLVQVKKTSKKELKAQQEILL